MTDIEVAALVIAAIWLGVLTVVTLLVVRQVGLITLRLDIAGQGAVIPADGLAIGVTVPDEVVARAPYLSDGLTYLLLLSGTCAPCRELAPQLASVETRGLVVSLVPGDEEGVRDLIPLIPPSYEVVRDPHAIEIAMALNMQRTPAVLEIEDSVVTGKAHLFSGLDFQRLIDAREHSDAAEIAKSVKEGRTHVHA